MCGILLKRSSDGILYWIWLRFDKVSGQEHNPMESVAVDILNKIIFKLVSCEV